MSSNYCQVSLAVFQKELLPGRDINPKLLSSMLHIEEDPDGEYFAFVRHSNSLAASCSQRFYFKVRKVNQILRLAKTGLVAKDLIAWYEAAGNGRGYQPAVAFYPTDEYAEKTYDLPPSMEKDAQIRETSKDLVARCCYNRMAAALDLRHSDDECAFGMEPDSPLLPDTLGAIESRTRFEHSVAQIMSHQHRTHVFMFYLEPGKYARVFRWDRSGAVATPPLSFETDLGDLWNIIYRLACADKATQGFDPTVSLATYPELRKLQEFHRPEDEDLYEYRIMFWEYFYDHPMYKVRTSQICVLKSLQNCSR